MEFSVYIGHCYKDLMWNNSGNPYNNPESGAISSLSRGGEAEAKEGCTASQPARSSAGVGIQPVWLQSVVSPPCNAIPAMEKTRPLKMLSLD